MICIPICKITIPDMVKAYRRKNGLSQVEFGRLMGVTAQAVCKWERGLCYPDITQLPRLAHVIGCTVCDFFCCE